MSWTHYFFVIVSLAEESSKCVIPLQSNQTDTGNKQNLTTFSAHSSPCFQLRMPCIFINDTFSIACDNSAQDLRFLWRNSKNIVKETQLSLLHPCVEFGNESNSLPILKGCWNIVFQKLNEPFSTNLPFFTTMKSRSASSTSEVPAERGWMLGHLVVGKIFNKDLLAAERCKASILITLETKRNATGKLRSFYIQTMNTRQCILQWSVLWKPWSFTRMLHGVLSSNTDYIDVNGHIIFTYNET